MTAMRSLRSADGWRLSASEARSSFPSSGRSGRRPPHSPKTECRACRSVRRLRDVQDIEERDEAAVANPAWMQRGKAIGLWEQRVTDDSELLSPPFRLAQESEMHGAARAGDATPSKPPVDVVE